MDKRQTVWKSSLVATVPPSLCLVICIKTQLAHGKPSKFNILSISYIGNKHKLKILCLIGTRSTLGSIVFHSLKNVCSTWDIWRMEAKPRSTRLIHTAWGRFCKVSFHACVPSEVITGQQESAFWSIWDFHIRDAQPAQVLAIWRKRGAGWDCHSLVDCLLTWTQAQFNKHRRLRNWKLMISLNSYLGELDYPTHRKSNIQLKIFK